MQRYYSVISTIIKIRLLNSNTNPTFTRLVFYYFLFLKFSFISAKIKENNMMIFIFHSCLFQLLPRSLDFKFVFIFNDLRDEPPYPLSFVNRLQLPLWHRLGNSQGTQGGGNFLLWNDHSWPVVPCGARKSDLDDVVLIILRKGQTSHSQVESVLIGKWQLGWDCLMVMYRC